MSFPPVMQLHTLTPLEHHAPVMDPIRLDTFGALLDHDHGLDCWCPGCRRWAACNLAALVAAGLGDSLIAANRPRCRKCGSIGEWQVRPPIPSFGGFEQYGMQ